MRVTKNKTKNGLSFYIIRSIDGGSTEVVEKLGTEKEIMEKYHCKDAEAWARERARKLTENEKDTRSERTVSDPYPEGSGGLLHYLGEQRWAVLSGLWV